MAEIPRPLLLRRDATADATVIRRAATECLRRVVLDRRLRLLGVRVSTLEKSGSAVAGELQHSLPLEDGIQVIVADGLSNASGIV